MGWCTGRLETVGSSVMVVGDVADGAIEMFWLNRCESQ